MGNILILDASAFFEHYQVPGDRYESLRRFLINLLLLLNPRTNKIGCPFDYGLFIGEYTSNKLTQDMILLKHLSRFLFSVETILIKSKPVWQTIQSAVLQYKGKGIIYIISDNPNLLQLQDKDCRYYSISQKALLFKTKTCTKYLPATVPGNIRVKEIKFAPKDYVNALGIDGLSYHYEITRHACLVEPF